MFGNMLIALSVISYGSLVHLLSRPAPSGDYGVGYAFVWLISVAGFAISTGLLAWNMNLDHCFDWAPTPFLRYRNWLVFLGWSAFALAIIWSLEYKSKWHDGEFPVFLRWFVLSRVYIWLPLLMFIPAGFLLNAQRQAGFAPYWVKISMQAGFIVSILIGLGIFYGFAKASVQRRITLYQTTKTANSTEENETWSFKTSMQEINKYNEQSIKGLLIYTHREKEERVRSAALAKIKSCKNWEDQLIDILNHRDLNEMYWVYAFLDGNNIEHPENFIQPVKNSLGQLTSGVQKSLKDPYSLHLGYINIEALCRVLDTQFKDSAAVFRPDMLNLHEVLQITPPKRKSTQDKQWFDETLNVYRLAVTNWLDSNQ